MKIKDNSGFSLAEMLLAILILLLVSGIVAAGVPAAANAYEKVVIGANAKVLLSTAISSLRNEITTAQDLTVKDNVIEYYSADDGATSRIYRNNDSGYQEIMLDEYTDLEPIPGSAKRLHDDIEAHSLVSEMAATADLFVTYDSVESTPGADALTIANLRVCRKSKPGTPLASVSSLTIRLIIPSSTEPST